MFAAYAFEARILDLANQFLDRDLFGVVDEAWRRRQTGWRPRGNACEGCGVRVWGVGVGGGVWEAWIERSEGFEREKERRRLRGGHVEEMIGRGKGRLRVEDDGPRSGREEDRDNQGEGDGAEEAKAVSRRQLVVFACRHVWHKDCLERDMERAEVQGERREFWCPAEHRDEES